MRASGLARPTAAPMSQPRERPKRGWPRGDRSYSGSQRGDEAAEVQLVLAAQRGGAREREDLVDRFMPLVATIARGYRASTRIDRRELMQEGVVGLLRALERYDPEVGVPFGGYAAWWVRQAMQRVVSELSLPIVLSDRALRQLARVKHAARRAEQDLKREATSDELAILVDLPVEQVGRLMRAERRARPLDEPASESAREGLTAGDLLADPPAEDAFVRTVDRVLAQEVPRLLATLTDRERMVICSRFGIGRREQTLREIAERLAVSAERVRQIEQASLEKLFCAARA